MNAAADIFLSYKAEDRRRVQLLVEALQSDGFTVWWDTHIGGGAHWRDDIQEHLDAAKCVIVAWSKRSVAAQGDFVRDEATRARKHGTYLPVLLDRVDPPLGFGEVQALPLIGWHGDRSDPCYQAVLAALRHTPSSAETSHAAHSQGHAQVSRRMLLVGGAAVAVGGVGAWTLLKPSPGGSHRIAVLPFVNLSGNASQSYFSDGIAEEVRSVLARASELQVVGRISSEAVRDDDAKTVARKLHVSNILVGSVRQSPWMIRVNAQLIDGRTGLERWSETYDRAPGDAIKIQTDIAENVARALNLALGSGGHAALAAGQTVNAAAHDRFLEAVSTYSSGNSSEALQRTISLLDDAIKLDPGFAEAFALRARAVVRLFAQGPSGEWRRGFAEAEANARKAISLAPTLAAAHTALATVLNASLDLNGALNEFRKAEQNGSNDVGFLLEYSKFLTNIGLDRQALSLARKAIDLDPLNPRTIWMEARALYTSRRYGDAIASGNHMLALSPGLPNALGIIGDSLTLLGRTDEARVRYSQMPPDGWGRLASEAILAARTGDRKGSDQLLAKLERLYGDSVIYQLAEVHSQRGETQLAVDDLERALAIRDPGLANTKRDPWLDPIRRDPRFATLLAKLNFPEV